MVSMGNPWASMLDRNKICAHMAGHWREGPGAARPCASKLQWHWGNWVTLSAWQQALAQPPHTVPAVCSNNARSPKTAISANSKGTSKAPLLGAVNVWLPSAWMCEAWRKIIKLIWKSLWDRIWDEYAANTLFWFNDVLEESACISQSSHIAVSKRCISRDDVTMSAGDSNPDPWKSWGQGSTPANSFTAGKV